MDLNTAPVLLLLASGEFHPWEAYLQEILLTEGYQCHETLDLGKGEAPPSLLAYPLVIVSKGAAERLEIESVLAYLAGGGRAVLVQPPREWAEALGLGRTGALYNLARDAYLQVNTAHPWLAGFPAEDLQVPGDSHVYLESTGEPLAFVAGQRACPSPFPAVALVQHGAGAAVVFTYDLAETVVRLHQGDPEKASTGADPDANRDGKFTPDDAFEGRRDYELRHVPQADLHQDLLVRALRGLMAEVAPLPRLWHYPGRAPALLFVDGDGDSMSWEHLEWVVETCRETGSRYTLYLMTAQIEAFERARVAALREEGFEFGVHPWAGAQPDLATWEAGLDEIMEQFTDKFAYQPVSLRAHSCIFPGWDENPRLLLARGLRMETSFAGGYRYVSGYLNGSALPVRFIGRDGEIIDCYEQSTIQTEDGSATTKCLLPPLSEEEALALARELMSDTRHRWHGVFHPYFHPVSLSEGSRVPCRMWFRSVLQEAVALGMPSVNASEWLAFCDARREARVTQVVWEEQTLRFAVQAPRAVAGLTVLLPTVGALRPRRASVCGEDRPVAQCPWEGLEWFGLVVELAEGASVEVVVEYG